MNKKKNHWNINNSYSKLPKKLYSKQLPEKSINPEKIYFNSNLASELGLNKFSESEILEYFSGNKIPYGSIPISQAYAGHQFGRFTMLGDGRAVLIAEHISPHNERNDIQLKGSGKTQFSRGGDGKATLSSVLREYIMSEAMHNLGIPTSRSLAIIKTGEKVFREKEYEGGILTRVLSSHIRFGTFEYVRNYCSKKELEIFFSYVLERHYPDLKSAKNQALNFFDIVMKNHIKLVVDWMRVGFIHGVMNTDNMSISAETIDYGPCAFMNVFNNDTVFSSIDRFGRYSFGNQPKILHSNLVILANTIIPLVSNNEDESIELLKDKIEKFSNYYNEKWYNMMFNKIGIINPKYEDRILVDSLLELMSFYKADYTNTFASLSMDSEYDDNIFKQDDFKKWRLDWKQRIKISKNYEENFNLMKLHNPIRIPRNYLVEIALKNSINGDYEKFNELLKITSKPYDYLEKTKLQKTPVGFDDSYKTFCGT